MPSPAPDSLPVGAVILGVEYQALGWLRQLTRSGIPCVLVDHDVWGLARFSRYAQRRFVAPDYSGPEFWPWLKALARTQSLEGWIVIPTDDEQVRALAENFAEVREVYRYAGLPWETYRSIYDKRLAYRLAVDLGLPAPRSFAPTAADPLPPEGSLGHPFIVKPAIKREFARVSKKKALLVQDNDELRRLQSGLLANVPLDELIYQELIPGGGSQQWSYAGFFVEGRPIAAFTAVRSRQKPPDFGRSSTFVISAANAEVEAESLKLLRALKYTGLAEVEWKRNQLTGQLQFLEVNARSWGWHSLAAGVVGNLPLQLHRYLTTGVAEPAEPVYGAKWIKWITDLPVATHMITHGTLAAADYARSFRGRVISCEWDWRDPLPFVFQFALVPYLIFKRGY
jgi:D-aspartate ligase